MTRSFASRARFEIVPGRISGIWRLCADPVVDARGFFAEINRHRELQAALKRPYRFAQSNHSRSQANTLRGFRSEPWDKLVYVPRGTALCVVVDPRPQSPTFRTHETFLLGDPPGRREKLLISEGLCNAFYAMTEVDYLNDVSAEFEPSVRRGFRWDDATLGIDWPCSAPILSESDRTLPNFEDFLRGH